MDFFSFVFNTAGRLFTYSDFQWPDASVATKQCFFFFFLIWNTLKWRKEKAAKYANISLPIPLKMGNWWTVLSHLEEPLFINGENKKDFFFLV